MINLKYKKYVKLAIALFILVLGSAFMVIPFIPLGFIFLFGGSLLLIRYIPFLNRQLNQLKRRTKNKRLEKIEEKVYNIEERIVKFLVREPDVKRCAR
jgi:hypothetical protein